MVKLFKLMCAQKFLCEKGHGDARLYTFLCRVTRVSRGRVNVNVPLYKYSSRVKLDAILSYIRPNDTTIK